MTSGATAGQCKTARGIAVNLTGAGGVPVGSVYVVDAGNARVQQFSAAGAFIRAFGKEVDETTGGDVCPAGDVCKAGTSGPGAGALTTGGSYGIAVDQSTGTVYVSSRTNRRVDVFSATGTFEGAIGWNVDAAAAAEELQFCTTATGCKAGFAGTAAGQLSNLELSGLAVDPRDGDLYVADHGNLRLAEYAIQFSGDGEVTGATFVRALGWKVNATMPAEELQSCTASTGCQKGTAGSGAGQFIKENPGPIAVDSAGDIYAINVKYTGACSTTEPCRVLKFNPDGTFEAAFGPAIGECQLTYTSGAANTQEAFAIAVDPLLDDADNRVYVAKKTAAGEYRVYEFDEDDSSCTPSPGPNSSALAGPTGVVSVGLAVGTEARLYANDGGAEVALLGEAPAPAVAFGQATDILTDGAELTGVVTPPAEREGTTFDTTWHFEYSTDQAHWTSVPVPDHGAGAVPNVPVPVETTLTGLAPRTTYFARLCATTGPTVCDPSPSVEFTTKSARPTVAPFSAEVTQTVATLGAEVNPNNLATRYHVEWATQSEWEQSPGTYAHRVPTQDRQIGTGSEAVLANEHLSGLDPAGRYHFRVVASNSVGTTTSPDQQVETLNSCGMTAGRCLELVSRVDKGPLASPGKMMLGGAQPQFQAAPAGSALAYTVELGYPDATAEDEAVYLGRRGAAGWSSAQLGPPSLASGGSNGVVKYLSPSLGCGVVASRAPLVADAPATVIESGGSNLYRRDASGSYELITALPPVGPPTLEEVFFYGGLASSREYLVVGASPDCRRVVFRTMYRYPGAPSTDGRYQLYEWDHGTIRNVAIIPGPGGVAEPVPAEAIPGAIDEGPGSGQPIGAKSPTDYWRAVSAAGTRSIFTAVSRFGPDAGKRAVFLRDADNPAVLAGVAPAIDISQSETAIPNDGNSRYWTASSDGARVFFTARYGLAANGSSSGATSCANAPLGSAVESSGEGCDLYEYDLGKPAGERLTDLSPDLSDAKGAGVVGVLDASEDGSHVYFAARGYLGGAGRSEAENLTSATYNLYLALGGAIHFVRTIGQAETISGRGALVATGGNAKWTARASVDGTAFAFESSFGTLGGVSEVYLYSAANASIVCVSCRHDGQAPFSADTLTPLISAEQTNPPNWSIQPTVLSDEGRVYFYSFDPLATGAIEGARNLYLWEHGQVSLIAAEPEGVPRGKGNPTANFFGGASADGDDVYFTTPLALVHADRDKRWDVYDARVGGGFPESASPTPPCDAVVEGGCNSGGGNAASPMAPATSNFTGPANPPPPKHKHHKKKHKHHKKKHKHHKKGKHKHHKRKTTKNQREEAGKPDRANGHRRAGK